MVSTAGVHLVGRAQATLVHCGWLGKVAEKDRSALTPGLELLEHASTLSKILVFCFPIRSIDAAHVERPWWGGPTLHSRRHLVRALQCNQTPDSTSAVSITLHGRNPGYMTSPRLTDERHYA